jgi:hypothetical protein
MPMACEPSPNCSPLDALLFEPATLAGLHNGTVVLEIKFGQVSGLPCSQHLSTNLPAHPPSTLTTVVALAFCLHCRPVQRHPCGLSEIPSHFIVRPVGVTVGPHHRWNVVRASQRSGPGLQLSIGMVHPHHIVWYACVFSSIICFGSLVMSFASAGLRG